MRTRAQIVERARLHVGHREMSSNRSPLIDAWLRRCGLGPGYPWCAAFASWCVEERRATGKGGQTVGADIVPVACAGALNLGRLFPATRKPQPGDLMYFATNDAGAGHVGIVVAGDDSEVLCIEGNSDNRVRYARRLRSEVKFASTRDESLALPLIEDGVPFPLVRVSLEGTR